MISRDTGVWNRQAAGHVAALCSRPLFSNVLIAVRSGQTACRQPYVDVSVCSLLILCHPLSYLRSLLVSSSVSGQNLVTRYPARDG